MLTCHRNRFLLPVVTVLLALLATGSAFAADTVQNVGGLTIYLGVLPAEMLKGRPANHAESTMHGGAPADAGRQRHVLIAVFDAASGARIEDAVVTAKVGEPGLAKVEKRLEPMPIAGAASYGNYFSMSSPGTYQIEVRVVQPSTGRTVDARFTYVVPR